MNCLGTPVVVGIEDPTPTKPEPEPEYVTQLREEIADLKERVRRLENSDNYHHHGGTSDDE
jgi:hypothetical protein